MEQYIYCTKIGKITEKVKEKVKDTKVMDTKDKAKDMAVDTKDKVTASTKENVSYSSSSSSSSIV